MELLIKTGAVSIAAVILSALLKKDNAPAALLLTLAGAAVIIGALAEPLREIICQFVSIAEDAGISSPVLNAVIKTVGISITTRLLSDFCKDSGAGAAASAVELAGTVCGIIVVLPIMASLLSMIGGLI